MNKNRGQNLTEVAILMTVVGVVCISAYTLLGNNLNQLFQGSATKFQGYDPKTFMNTTYGNTTSSNTNSSNTLTTAGQWNGGKGKPPVSKCLNGVCDIDFGDYILSGVPANLTDIVDSNGASGANDKVYSLYMQLANQLAAEGKTAESQDFKDLANLAKYMGSIQKKYEDTAKACVGNINEEICVRTGLGDLSLNQSIPGIPTELNHLLSPTSENTYYFKQVDFSDLGYSRYEKTTSPTNANSKLSQSPGMQFITIYDKIKNSASLSNNIKGIAKELLYSVNDINLDFDLRQGGARVPPPTPMISVDPGFLNIYNPETGAYKTSKGVTKTTFTKDHTSTSNMSDALTCYSANLEGSCHQTMN